jgi:signal peptidase I, archaeal type
MDRIETQTAPAHARRRGVVGVVGDAVLWVASVAGASCIVLTVLAVTTQITIVMFATGSMGPTIPAGAIAIVQRVPASEIEVGDIVTVDRGDRLPMTHRVTSVAPGASPDERVLTMRGDANEHDDPHPYPVESARKVLFSVPGVAVVLAWFGEPWVVASLATVVGLLVVWAFWPRTKERNG